MKCLGIGIGTIIYETVGAGGVNDVTVATLQVRKTLFMKPN